MLSLPECIAQLFTNICVVITWIHCRINYQIYVLSLPEFIAELITDIVVVRSTFIYSYISVGINTYSGNWAGFFVVCLHMYCRLRSSYQKGGEGGDPINRFNPATLCAYPKPGHGFQTTYVMVLFVFSEFI